MSDLATFGTLAGTGSTAQSVETNILFGRETDVLRDQNSWLASTGTDAGNTPSTTIRTGMLMGRITSSGDLVPWDATSTNGSQYVWGILNQDINLLDQSGVAAKNTGDIIRRAPLVSGSLLIKGVALIGHNDEFLARKQLLLNGCLLDDDNPCRHTSLGTAMANVSISAASHSPTAADNGTRFNYTQAGTVTVTLPALVSGLVFEFLQTVAQTMVVQSTAGTDVINLNSLGATSITFSTSGKEIGALVRFESIYEGTVPTLKWLCTIPTTPLGTGMTGGVAYALA